MGDAIGWMAEVGGAWDERPAALEQAREAAERAARRAHLAAQAGARAAHVRARAVGRHALGGPGHAAARAVAAEAARAVPTGSRHGGGGRVDAVRGAAARRR